MADIKKGLTNLRVEKGGLIVGEGADAVRITVKDGNLELSDATTHVDSMYPNHWPFGGYPNYIPSDEEVSNFDYMYPPDNTPVALLPGAIRAAKRFAAYFASTKAAFSADVVDGDVVYLDTDGIWKPALAPLTEAAIPKDKKPFYGVAFLARREVVIGPMIKHLKWKFNIGDKLYLSDSEAGKLTTRATTIPFATAVAPDTIYVSMLGADISTSLDELEKVITDRLDALDAELKALEGRVDVLETTVAEHTQTIKEEKARLDGALSSIAQLRAQLGALEQKFNQHISGDGGHIVLTDRIDLDDSTKGASAKAAKTLADMIQKFSTVDVMSIDPFVTDGTSTDYKVGDDVVLDTNANNLFLVVGGVVQEPYVAYTVPDNKTIRFATAPARDLRCWGAASMNYSNPDIREALKKALAQLQLEGNKLIALARAWAESDTNPDPDDPDSKSAKTWANSVKETIVQEVAKQVPLATTTKPGIMQVGFGLSVKNGIVDVNFDNAPTDKFEALLKQIKVPIWLERDLKVYVATNGSDTLDEGRGLSAQKPFKTLSAALLYVSNIYNIGKYVVYVNVADGDYGRAAISLPLYNATTGYIIIQGSTTDYDGVKIGNISNSFAVPYTLKNLTCKPDNYQTSVAGISAAAGVVNVRNVCVDLTTPVEDSSGSRVGISASDSGVIVIEATEDDDQNGLWFRTSSVKEPSVLLDAVRGGIKFSADINILNSMSPSIAFVRAQQIGRVYLSTSVRPNPGRAPRVNLLNSAKVTGSRYLATGNSIIDVARKGAEFFPGTLAGEVNTGGQYL